MESERSRTGISTGIPPHFLGETVVIQESLTPLECSKRLWTEPAASPTSVSLSVKLKKELDQLLTQHHLTAALSVAAKVASFVFISCSRERQGGGGSTPAFPLISLSC